MQVVFCHFYMELKKWKKQLTKPTWIGYNQRVNNRGVAQLVARLLWEQDAGCSSHLTPTKNLWNQTVPEVFHAVKGFSCLLRQPDFTLHSRTFSKMKISYKKLSNFSSIICNARWCYHAKRNTDSLL